MNLEKLDMLGTGLFWGEGTKSRNQGVIITNGDPEIIRVFVNWLKLVHKVPQSKFRISLMLHDADQESSAKEFWSKITDIPTIAFNKTTIYKARSTSRGNKRAFGFARVCVYDKKIGTKVRNKIDRITKSWA